MPEDRSHPREGTWQEFVSWLTFLARSFRIAISMRVLILAAMAMIGTSAGWRLIGWGFYSEKNDRDADFNKWIKDNSQWPWQETRLPVLASDLPSAAATNDPVRLADRSLDGELVNPFFNGWLGVSQAFYQLFDDDHPWRVFTYFLGCGLWALVVWALFGGAITRIAAAKLAREDHVGIRQGLDYARSKWGSYFWAPLFPMVGVLLATIPMLLGGLMLRADIGVMVAAFLWPLALLGGLFLAILLLGVAFGWPLMWGTISTEGTDAFDALSRSYAYCFQRPLHYFLYIVVASVIGALGYLLVSIVAVSIIELTWWAVAWGSGLEHMHKVQAALLEASSTASDTFNTGAQIIGFWNGCVMMISGAFVFSYFWSAAAAIYLLLRYHVDQTELDDMAVQETDQPHGLPPLPTDVAGVPGAPDERPAPMDTEPPPADDLREPRP